MRITGLLLLALLILTLTGCGQRPAPTGNGKLLVIASIAPLAYFTQRIGGERVEVETLIPPAASPHTWEPLPADLVELSRARLLVMNGLGLEFWSTDAITASGNPKLVVVETASGLPTVADKEHGGVNPHTWLDPALAAKQAEAIRDALVKLDPAGAQAYQKNTADLLQDLAQLDQEIAKTVATFPLKRFVSQHASWAYFAKRYGLIEAGVVETRIGQEPSPRELETIINTVKQSRARAVFAEPQFPHQAADAIAAEVGVKVLMLDTFGAPPNYDYFAMMRANLRKMKEALG
jgi:ABC-type Zn uptake system ZnuABC Zn-binding protein ZnuA